jgi:hypothetical protein
MANNKNPEIFQTNKKDAKEICDYIQSNLPNCKVSNNAGIVFEKGVKITKESFMIPRRLLKLNTENGRFKTAISKLKAERIHAGQSPDFDMNDVKDVEIIREMLKGNHPKDLERSNKYKTLKDEIEKASFEFGTNGIEKPCIITADGIYINGNNRDTILEDLRNKQLKKRTGTPEKYDNIEVIICGEITMTDIGSMELREQVSKDLRSEFDAMNSSILTRKVFLNQMAVKGPGKEAEVIQWIAGTMEGRDIKFVKKLLEFADFVDQVLIQLKIPGEHHKINSEADESVSVTTIIKRYSEKYTSAAIGDKANIIYECAANVQGVMMKSKITDPTHYDYSSRKLWESIKLRNKSPSAIKMVSNYDWLQHDFTSTESCKKFGKLLHDAEEKAKDEKMIDNPSILLNDANNKLITISDSLKGPQNKKIKMKLVQAKVDRHLKTIKDSIKDIEDTLDKIKI